MKLPEDIIVRPVLSEKSYGDIANKKYTFVVDRKATKHDIRNAIETIYKDQGVRVDRVNTVNCPGKVRVRGRIRGMTPAHKKAYVRLTEDSGTIKFFDSLN